MSDIQDLGKQIFKLASDTNTSAADLYNMANELRKTTEAVQHLMQSTSQHNYQNIINQLGVAQNKLASATASLVTASHSAKDWLDRHVSGSMSPLSPAHMGDLSYSEMQDASINKTPLSALGEYMSSHNYGDGDYTAYSQDPVWRALHRAAFPEDVLTPIAQATAYDLLMRFMSENNYGINDFDTYSQNPIWQELHEYAFPERFARPDPSSSSQGYASMVDSLEHTGVGYQTLKSFGRERTSEEIINRLGGGDNTEGSCSSLAFAYAGNVAGYDILDFRDGQSRSFFSRNSSIEMVANLPGIDSVILRGKDDISCTNNLLNRMTQGKEYYLATGVHAAIVRRLEDHFEYLELQHPTNNGWNYLDDYVLLNRFHCSQSNSFECPNYLIDVASLARNHEFLGVLGYLNTTESEQRKGGNGYVR